MPTLSNLVRSARIAASHAYDLTLCSPRGVRLAPAPKNRSPDVRGPISVGIPNYNRGSLIHRPLRNLLGDPRVGEIVIVDDGSGADEWAALQRNVRLLDKDGKVRLHRRAENRGAMFTKMECVRRGSLEWMVILDSDNTLFRSYLDALYREPIWRPDTIYCASAAFPYFRFDALVGPEIDFDLAARLCREGTLRRVYIINDGNYFVHRDRYLGRLGQLDALTHDVADVMVANYLWLSLGGRLKVLPGATYFHRIDASSFWMRTREESRRRVLHLFNRLERGLRWDDGFLRELQDGQSG